MTNTEVIIWTWIYLGMAAGVVSMLIVLWAILYENKDKE